MESAGLPESSYQGLQCRDWGKGLQMHVWHLTTPHEEALVCMCSIRDHGHASTSLLCAHASCEAQADRYAQPEEIDGKQAELEGLREQAAQQAQQLRNARTALARVRARISLLSCDSGFVVSGFELCCDAAGLLVDALCAPGRGVACNPRRSHHVCWTWRFGQGARLSALLGSAPVFCQSSRQWWQLGQRSSRDHIA